MVKLITLFFIVILHGCSEGNIFEYYNGPKTFYAYTKIPCNTKSCPLKQDAKLILNINPDKQEITYKLISDFSSGDPKFDGWKITSYEALTNCKVISRSDFQCHEISMDDGHLSRVHQYDSEANEVPDNSKFSKFELFNDGYVIHLITKFTNLNKDNIEILDKWGLLIVILLFLGLFST